MEVTIHQLLEGAREARGVTVVIDVFRAYSVESYAFAGGMERIYPVGNLEEAYELDVYKRQPLPPIPPCSTASAIRTAASSIWKKG